MEYYHPITCTSSMRSDELWCWERYLLDFECWCQPRNSTAILPFVSDPRSTPKTTHCYHPTHIYQNVMKLDYMVTIRIRLTSFEQLAEMPFSKKNFTTLIWLWYTARLKQVQPSYIYIHPQRVLSYYTVKKNTHSWVEELTVSFFKMSALWVLTK